MSGLATATCRHMDLIERRWVAASRDAAVLAGCRPFTVGVGRRHTSKAVGIALMLLFLSCLAAGSSAQTADSRETFAFSASLGRHGLGAGLELPLVRPVALAARGELLLLPTRYAAAGVGGRINLVSEDQASVYAVGLYGVVRCRPHLDGSGGCIDRESHAAVAALGGAEIYLGNGAWSAGIEAGYWFASSRAPAAADVDHLTFAAVLRWRP